MRTVLLAALSMASFLPSILLADAVVSLDTLDLSLVQQGWGQPRKNLSVDGNPLRIAGKKYERGLGTHATSRLHVRVDGRARRFQALAGMDDEVLGSPGTVIFSVYGDGELLFRSDVVRPGDPPVKIDVALDRVGEVLLLVGSALDSINYDHADWVNARFLMRKGEPVAVLPPREKPVILTPAPGPAPRLTGPRIVGARPGKPFLHRITATGEGLVEIEAEGLPRGLALDPVTGIVRGRADGEGLHEVKVRARNDHGIDERSLRIKISRGWDALALTPPLGWNSWNCWGLSVDDEKVRAAARAFKETGLADHGWTTINIDDGWEIRPDGSDPLATGPERLDDGRIRANRKFPDMRRLTDEVHALGLKIGLYSSPGPLTCGGYTGSHGFEELDARRWAEWGFDYVKYDWCSYGSLATDDSRDELMKPYLVMRQALDTVDRDIVFSLCQYGMGKVSEWGAKVGGNLWRTTGDITDTWDSMAGIGFSQAGLEEHAGPGRWNDPDMLVVGHVGWGPELRPSRLSPNEQYTHVSLWCLLASPLLIGCDLEKLDAFTLSLLTNDEVLDVNQDPLGRQAHRVARTEESEVWMKLMEDGSLAVGLFNTGEIEREVSVSLRDLGLTGRHQVRDLWRQVDRGVVDAEIRSRVPRHGVLLCKVSRVQGAGGSSR